MDTIIFYGESCYIILGNVAQEWWTIFSSSIFAKIVIVATELLIPSEHCLSCRRTSRKPVLDHKYYVKRFNTQCRQQISGLGTFINNIESIGQDDCMTGKAPQDRFLDTLT